MTRHIQTFLQQVKNHIGLPTRVLEVGSLNVNGTARTVFQTPQTDYFGIDLQAGKDVDAVLDAHDLMTKFSPEQFDLVICCEMLEHDLMPWVTVQHMRTVLKHSGWLVITTPASRVIKHNYPADYYRYFGETYRQLFFAGMGDIFVEEFCLPDNPEKTLRPDEIHGYARKL
jgi:SAM-dependent methyltransferase